MIIKKFNLFTFVKEVSEFTTKHRRKHLVKFNLLNNHEIKIIR